MKVALMMGWAPGSLIPKPKGQDRNFLGDEMTAMALRRELLKYDDIQACELFCDEHGMDMPEGWDVCIDLNPHCKGRDKAKKQILYYQNAPGEGSEKLWKVMEGMYDGVAFAAKKMWDNHGDFISRSGHKSIFLPLATDEKLFYPVPYETEYDYDLMYCGNDIKRGRTPRFFDPALRFKFGLFGRWSEDNAAAYFNISKGQIDFAQLRKLYSSSKVMINIHFQDALDYGLWAGRIFDVMACGGIVITDRPYGLPDEISKRVFIIEEYDPPSVVAYKYKNIIDMYPQLKAEAKQHRDFILNGHTWKHRAAVLHDYLQEFK